MEVLKVYSAVINMYNLDKKMEETIVNHKQISDLVTCINRTISIGACKGAVDKEMTQ